MSEKSAPASAPDANNGVAASFLAKLLSSFNGMHPESFRKGFKLGYSKGKESIRAPQVAPPVARNEIAIRLEDARGNTEARVQYDKLLLDDGRLQITPDVIARFKADALSKLGEDHQPTDEQWKAILSPTTSAVTIGIAGTGKTFVMMLRAVLLHVYLEIPIEDMTILAVTKDCRMDVMAELTHLLGKWGVNLSQEQAWQLVKTPRGALLQLIRAVPPLREVVPFELLGAIDSGDEDGRAFDPRLTAEQMDMVDKAYQHAYSRSGNFSRSIQALFAETVALPRAAPDSTQLIRYSEMGSAQIGADELLTKAVTSSWYSAGHWPVPEIEAQLMTLSVMGRTVHVNGYFPTLEAGDFQGSCRVSLSRCF